MYSFLALSHRQRKSGILTRKKEPRYLVLKLDSGASLLILIIFKFRGLNNAFKNQSIWFCCKKFSGLVASRCTCQIASLDELN